MSEIKNYKQFITALRDDFDNLYKQYEEQLCGIPICLKIIDSYGYMIEYPEIPHVVDNTDYLILVFKMWDNLKEVRQYPIFTKTIFDQSEDVVMIDQFQVIVIEDFIRKMISNRPDKIDEIYSLYKIYLRHELGHCLDKVSYLNMSWADYEAWDKYAEKTKHLGDPTKNVLRYVKNIRFCIDGVPVEYCERSEIAANIKAGFTPDELQLLYFGHSEFLEHEGII